MKIVIDTNLLFSAIIKPNGKIGEIILNPSFSLEIYGCYFSYIELFKHKEKILKVSKLQENELLEIMYQVFKKIIFINETTIPVDVINKAFNLTSNIDEKDTIFVALSQYLDCKIWSGDLELINGIRAKGFDCFFTTNELIEKLGI